LRTLACVQLHIKKAAIALVRTRAPACERLRQHIVL
jgi:hypothetical protein